MALIGTEDAARRLARAIASDILLYNHDVFQAGGDLRKEVEEGRELFRSRVAASLHPLYEEVISESFRRARGGVSPGVQAPAVDHEERSPPRPPPYVVHGNDQPGSGAASSRRPLMLLIGLAVGAAVFLILRWLTALRG